MGESLQDKLRQFPPFLCFALSRTHTKPLSREAIKKKFAWRNRKKRERLLWQGIRLPTKKMTRRMHRDEVAKRSGLHPRKVGRICFQTSWDNIYVGDMMAFLRGCGIDLMRLKRVRYQLKHGNKSKPLSHLNKFQLMKFDALCKKFCEINQSTP